MSLTELLNQIEDQPQQIDFVQVMAVISEHYNYLPTTFANGSLLNAAGKNEGSCKIFAFALLNKLNQQQTLACFGAYYRDDVLKHPQGEDHGNIRQFIAQGWQGIKFEGVALVAV
ncbi:MAG: HopJ type III effector protein [Gammaproteobacteria bacterium]|nr:HopJ type III effector protein [Gammaproteobacteria bacterium]